ncbi:peroxisomal membrane protein 11A [Rhinatrema bivittatum]|uniref:peroxisomal membrane protein 11A n=1 Tax=Rhinatrema bivittatum TaxID=194408 RepID=UPI00112B5DA1|nr:peroxisomal membrane protein 11A [Rhinatrema bivittatum]XP_029430534.1 peroxisomal membrane protein 11A [Rhinatrema bivittatum]XP_029430535.1 peroxisomal membrane protein 11A [Rhinatrema bivittatum]XP_029430536.1 peroxisomal membrane protein 11A [Rhinatrema bivittatum]XP_029430537.1 peroxisomal membrane protein 11A [Rhinatrema bivittatum]XP_029430538.1 peroxisomal membrane protein 11A [Rhinatrema bivittatum]XP_029430539.1 peroxisomal membrane protein 11A [Rhinatrema bivittatum]
MDAFVRFTNKSQGRDRLFRATQYTCMLLRYLLQSKTGKERVLMKLKTLESNMSSGRKLLRLGNMVHAVEAAKRTLQLPSLIPRFCLTISNVNRVLYFICDTILWARSTGLVSDINKEKWIRWATRYYFYSLLMNLARDLFEILQRIEKNAQDKKTEALYNHNNQEQDPTITMVTFDSSLLLLYCSLKNHPSLLLDTIKNLCDLFSPLDKLGIYKTNPGLIGLCGLLSSLVGILTVAIPQLQLK